MGLINSCCASDEYEAANTKDEDEEKYFEEFKQKRIIIHEPDQEALEKLPQDLQALYYHEAKYEINDNGSLTFWPTPNCEPSTTPLQSECMTEKCIPSNAECTKAVVFSDPDNKIVGDCNWRYGVSSFIRSSLTAWSDHYPFRFRPEHIWLIILQSVAVHVDQNAEKLRSKYC